MQAHVKTHLLEDLRFVIGLFFGILSLILLAASILYPLPPHASMNLNLYVGLGMGVFSILMMTLSRKPIGT